MVTARVKVQMPGAAIVDLTTLPDPRPVVLQTIVITRQLDDVLEGASPRFQQAQSTVQSEVHKWEAEVLQHRLDRRHLGHRAAPVVEHLDHVVAALADAELHHAGLTEREIDLGRARLRRAVVQEAAPYAVPAAAHPWSIAAVTR